MTGTTKAAPPIVMAPARGRGTPALTDESGTPIRMRDLNGASAFRHAAARHPDLGPARTADETPRPTGTGTRTVKREPYARRNAPLPYSLHDQRDQRWKDVVAGFLVHACSGIVRHHGQHEYSAVLLGPTAAKPFETEADAHAPTLGEHRDALDQAGPYGQQLCCVAIPETGEICGVLQVWHDERASYKALLGPRPYKGGPEQVVRIRDGLWQALAPAFLDLFGEQLPDRVHLRLVCSDLETDGGRIRRPSLGATAEQILQRFDETTHGTPQSAEDRFDLTAYQHDDIESEPNGRRKDPTPNSPTIHPSAASMSGTRRQS